MQFVNNTDKTIVLEPGEGVHGTTSILGFNGSLYRLQLEGRVQYVEGEELTTAEDMEEDHV